MKFFRASGRWLLGGWLLWLLAGCSFPTGQGGDELQETHFLTGRSRVHNMDYRGAAEAFTRALEVNPNSSAAHFELGLLCATRLVEEAASPEERDRILGQAIMHLSRHLELNPKSPLADRAREQVLACKMDLSKTVPITMQSAKIQSEMSQLHVTNVVLRQQIEQFKLQFAQQAHTYSNRLATLQAQWAAAAAARAQDSASQTPPRRIDPVPPLAGSSFSPPTDQSASNPTLRSTQEKPRSSASDQIAARRPVTRPTKPAVSQPVRSSSPPPVASLPRPKFYVIRPGDAPATIAAQYGISVGALQAANPGVDLRGLRTGKLIKLPPARM